MSTLSELLTAKTEAQILNELIATADALGLPVTDWISGAVERTNLQIDARTFSKLHLHVPEVVKGGYVRTAFGSWLDILAKDTFEKTRELSKFAEYSLTLSCDNSVAGYSFSSGTLTARADVTRLYELVEPVVVPQNGSAFARFRAVGSGSYYNVNTGMITSFVTPHPGLTVTNAVGKQLLNGADEESDERLQQRCMLSWAERSTGQPRDTYKAWALAASARVSKVKILDQNTSPVPMRPAPGTGLPFAAQGSVDVVLHGQGGLGSEVVTDDRVTPPTPFYPTLFVPGVVNTYIHGRHSETTNVYVYTAQEFTVRIEQTIYVKSAYRASALLAIQNNILALEARLDIGAKLYLSQLTEEAMTPEGVVNAVVTALKDAGGTPLAGSPADYQLPALQVAVLIYLPTVVEV